jgi:glutathione S-transferase
MSAMAEPLTLYIGNKAYSSWSMRPWLALKAAGLDFTEVLVPLYESGTPDDLARLKAASPTGKVPCLRFGDNAIWDSLAIIEFAAELAPAGGLWPENMIDRARARSICAEMHSGFAPLRQHLGYNARKTFPGFAVPDAAKPDIARIEALWAECLDRSGGPFLFGGFGAADCMYAPVVGRLLTYDVAVSATTHGYMTRVLDQPAVQLWYAQAKAETMVIPRLEHVG